MGLRELLGLPPKTGGAAQNTATTGASGDPATFGAARAALVKLRGDPRFASISQAEKDALSAAVTRAEAEAGASRWDRATAQLQDGIRAAVQAVMRAGTAEADYDKTAPKASGVLDAAALWGCDAKHLAALRARFNAAQKLKATDLRQAADDMLALGAELARDPLIAAAKAARDRYLAEHARIEAEAATALLVPQETPGVLKAHRILAAAVQRLGGLAGRLDYPGAVGELDRIVAQTAAIQAEAPKVQAMIALRDQLQADRAKIDADVRAARLLFGFDDPSKELVEAFGAADKAFEGFMYQRDYPMARSELVRLTQLTARVIVLKPEVDRQTAEAADARAAQARIMTIRADILGIDSLTAAMKALDKQFNAQNKLMRKAREDDDFAALVAMEAVYVGLLADYRREEAAAGAEIADQAARQTLWDTQGQKRYTRALKKKLTLPEAVTLRSDLTAAVDEANRLKAATDFTGSAAALDRALALLDRLDALAGEDQAARGRKAEAVKRFNAGKAGYAAAVCDAFTPEMSALQAELRQNYQGLLAACNAGDAGAMARLDALDAVLPKIAAEKAANDAAKGGVEAAYQGALAKLVKRLVFAEDRLAAARPHSDALAQKLTEGEAALDAARGTGDLVAAQAAITRLGQICDEIKAAKADWALLTSDDKAAYDQRLSEVEPDYLTGQGFRPVSVAIRDGLAACKLQWARVRAAAKKKQFSDALRELEQLAPLVSGLMSQRGEHDALSLARASTRTLRAGIRNDVDAAIQGGAYLPAVADLVARMKALRAKAEQAYDDLDFRVALTDWTELDRLLTEWRAKEGDNDAVLQSADYKTLTAKWNGFVPTDDIIDDMAPITPELKTLFAAYRPLRSRFVKLWVNMDFAEALAMVDAMIAAGTALAAKKADYDAALVLAEAKAQTARGDLDAIDPADLKAKPMAERLQLLDDLRATGAPLSDADRKLQRKLYDALDYDPEFKKGDLARRGALVDALLADDEVVEARDKWGEMSTDDRLKVLMKVLMAECRVYDIPPPKVRLFCEPPGDEGYFSGATMTLNLNTHPFSDFGDYKEAVNTVVHENAHNYQEVLVQRLREGILRPEDPDYGQALIFAANDGVFGYVDPDEEDTIDDDEPNRNPYKTQPVEAHAWDTGDGVAADLVAGKPPARGVTL